MKSESGDLQLGAPLTYAKALPKSHILHAYPAYLLGNACAQQEKHLLALAMFERNLSIVLKSKVGPWRRGFARYLLARSLMTVNPTRNRSRATALALQARKDYLSIDGPMKKQVRLVDEFLQQYGIKIPKESGPTLPPKNTSPR